MKITVVGAGNMARGIATRALVGGHTVTVTAKDPGKAVRLVENCLDRQPAKAGSPPPTNRPWTPRTS